MKSILQLSPRNPCTITCLCQHLSFRIERKNGRLLMAHSGIWICIHCRRRYWASYCMICGALTFRRGCYWDKHCNRGKANLPRISKSKLSRIPNVILYKICFPPFICQRIKNSLMLHCYKHIFRVFHKNIKCLCCNFLQIWNEQMSKYLFIWLEIHFCWSNIHCILWSENFFLNWLIVLKFLL